MFSSETNRKRFLFLYKEYVSIFKTTPLFRVSGDLYAAHLECGDCIEFLPAFYAYFAPVHGKGKQGHSKKHANTTLICLGKEKGQIFHPSGKLFSLIKNLTRTVASKIYSILDGMQPATEISN